MKAKSPFVQSKVSGGKSRTIAQGRSFILRNLQCTFEFRNVGLVCGRWLLA